MYSRCIYSICNICISLTALLSCMCVCVCSIVPAVIVDLLDLHHGSETGQAVVCVAGGSPVPEVEWYICKNIKQ